MRNFATDFLPVPETVSLPHPASLLVETAVRERELFLQASSGIERRRQGVFAILVFDFPDSLVGA